MASPKIVRALFEEKLKTGVSPCKFHPLDLQRVNDDRFLMRIIAHVEGNTQDALNMLWDILVWRGTVGASDINETNIKMDYVKEGSIFPHGRDVDGCLLLVLNPKIYRKTKKDIEEVKKILIYWFDRIERQENGRKISVFCDMSDHGMVDFDIALSNFIITLFRKYYPHFFNYLIIFQLHWSLSSTCKMLRSLLPPRAATRMKIVTKYTLSKAVQLDHALRCWGGRDNYQYKFVPETEVNIAELKKIKLDHDKYSNGMVHLKADNVIIFRRSNNKLLFCMLLTITNTHESAVFFEIRTTAPDKFCISPNTSALDVGKSKSLIIFVQENYDSLTMEINTLLIEKFMVITMPIPDSGVTRDEIIDIWHKSKEFKMQEYTFRNLLNEVEDASTIIENSINDLGVNNQTIQTQLYCLKHYQLLTLIVVIFAVFVFYFKPIWY